MGWRNPDGAGFAIAQYGCHAGVAALAHLFVNTLPVGRYPRVTVDRGTILLWSSAKKRALPGQRTRFGTNLLICATERPGVDYARSLVRLLAS